MQVITFDADAQNKVPTGAMIAWYPALTAREAAALPRDDAETPTEMHVTLAYLGKAADLDDATVRKIHRDVELIARAFGPFTVERSGTGIFETEDDGTCVVALMDSAVLEKLQETIVNELTEDEVNLPSKHGFTAHMTLVYLPDGEAPTSDELAIRGAREYVCDNVAVVIGGEITRYPLGVAALEFGESEGHPFRGNQWTNNPGREEGVRVDRAKRAVLAKEQYRDRLINGPLVPRSESKLAAHVDQLVGTLPADPVGWFQPVPASSADAFAVADKAIDDKYPPGSEQNAYAHEYLAWQLEVKAAGAGYAPSPGNFRIGHEDGSYSGPEGMNDIKRDLVGTLDSTTYVPRSNDERLYRVDQELEKVFGHSEDPDVIERAHGYAEYKLGMREDNPFEGMSAYGRITVNNALVDPVPYQRGTDELTDRMRETEGTLREIGSAVTDRADEIMLERGAVPREQLDAAIADSRAAVNEARDAQAALNEEYGLGGRVVFPFNDDTIDMGSQRAIDSWKAMTPEQKDDYLSRAADINVDALGQEHLDNVRALQENGLDRREALFSALNEVRPMGPGDTGGFKLFREDHDAVVVRAAERYYPTDWIRQSNDGSVMDVRETNGRGYYQAFGSTQNGGADLRYSSGSTDFGENGLGVMAHELGHRMEATVPGVREAEFAQYARRTDGDAPERMGSGYRRDEITKPDEFFNRYVGKIYDKGDNKSSREMLSMGTQSLVNTGYVATGSGPRDVELEQLVLGMLAAVPGKR